MLRSCASKGKGIISMQAFVFAYTQCATQERYGKFLIAAKGKLSNSQEELAQFSLCHFPLLKKQI